MLDESFNAAPDIRADVVDSPVLSCLNSACKSELPDKCCAFYAPIPVSYSSQVWGSFTHPGLADASSRIDSLYLGPRLDKTKTK